MPTPSSNLPSSAATAHGCGRPLTVAELSLVLEELDRVMADLEMALTELSLSFDEPSRLATRAAIATARKR